MKKIIGLIAFLFIFIKIINAQADDNLGVVAMQIQNVISSGTPFEQVSIFRNSSLRNDSNGSYLELKVDDTKLKKLFSSKSELIELTIPAMDGGETKLMLIKHEALTEDFRIKLTGGKETEATTIPEVLFYQGIIKNDNHSIVAITVFENEVNGVISDNSGNYNLGKNKLDATNYVLYNDKKVQLPFTFECGDNVIDAPAYTNEINGTNKLLALSYCQRITFTCDYDMYLAFDSNSNNVFNYVASLFNVVGTFYKNEGINMFVQTVEIYATLDPFCETSSDCALTSYKLTNVILNGANIIHLLAMDIYGNGGRADLGSLTCAAAAYSNIEGSFYAFPTYSWDANVVAHEMGHNLNSRHTHECVWNGNATAIDNCNIYWGSATLLGPLQSNCSGGFNFPLGNGGLCPNGPSPGSGGGTVMSYCHGCSSIGINFSNGLGLQPGNVMRNFINNALCFTTCNNVCLPIIYVGANVLSGNAANYNSNDILYAGSTLQAGSNVLFTANNRVQLNPGFIAENGCMFIANNTSCTPIAAPNFSKASALINGDIHNNIQVAPNPFNDIISVSLNVPDNASIKFALYNTLGEMVIPHLIKNGVEGWNKFDIEGSSLRSGVYTLHITINGNLQVLRVIKC